MRGAAGAGGVRMIGARGAGSARLHPPSTSAAAVVAARIQRAVTLAGDHVVMLEIQLPSSPAVFRE